MSLWLVLPFGLGKARLPIVKNGSSLGITLLAVLMGSILAAGRPRMESTNRSPRPTRRRIFSALLRNSNIVTVFIDFNFKLKLNDWQDHFLRKQIQNRFTQTVMSHVEGPLFDFVAEFWRDAHRVENAGVEILDDDAFLKGLAGALIGRFAV